MRQIFLVLVIMFNLISISCASKTPIDTLITTPDQDYVYLENMGVVNLVCRIWNIDKTEQIDLVFAWDKLDEEKAYIYIDMNIDAHPVDDYMLVFRGDINQAFPMERNEVGDPNKEMFIVLKKKDLMGFLYELTHSNTPVLIVELTSAHVEDERKWILEHLRIPEYINH